MARGIVLYSNIWGYTIINNKKGTTQDTKCIHMNYSSMCGSMPQGFCNNQWITFDF